MTISKWIAGGMVLGLAVVATMPVMAQIVTEEFGDADSIVTLDVDAPAEAADPYTWSATKAADGTMSFAGYVPAETMQRFLAVRGGEGVTDTTSVAPGAPEDFGVTMLAALDALAALEQGSVRFDGESWSLEGTTPSVAAEVALVTELSSAVDIEGWTIELEAAPESEPVEQPEPVEAVPEQPETSGEPEAETQLPAVPPPEPQISAEPEPATTDAASGPEAQQTEAEPVSAEPEPSEPEPTEGAPAEQEPAETDAAPTSSEPAEIEPTVDPDYAFAAEKSDGGGITLSGMAPAASTLSYFSVVTQSDAIEMEIAPGAPEDFVPSAVAGLRALVQLESGALTLEEGDWSLSGEASSVATADAVAAAIAELPQGASWQVSVEATEAAELCRDTLADFSSRNAILFASGSATITADSRAAVEELARDIAACPDLPVYIAGHTDADGGEAANLALSVARAEAVTAALIDLGITPSRLYAIGYGEAAPVADNDTAEGKRRNRRIVVSVDEPA